MSSANKVLTVARAEIGTKESPRNSNKVKYAKEYGMNGQPWCAMFVWWVFKHAGCPELFYGGKKSAYCPSIADYYIENKQTVDKDKGKPGDIVLFDWNKNNSSDHIGLIEKKNSDGTYTTIEGNTSLSNNANGGQVMRRTRRQSEISWICRPKYTDQSGDELVVYLSPSNHGDGNNKCLKTDCYEDKHTRPIAEEAAKHLKASGIKPIIAAKGTTLKERCAESDKVGAALHVPIHTNAAKESKTRYLMLMFYADTDVYRDMFDDVAPYLEAIYPNKKKAVFDVRPDLVEIKTPNAKTLYCELGFHTNTTDVNKFIHKPEVVGKALAQGICKILGVTFKSATKETSKTPAKKPATKVEKLKEDGEWGEDTTKKSQKVFGTVVDGEVSNQLESCKKYLPNCNTGSWEFVKKGCGGSALIKAIQKLVGEKEDGEAGKKTAYAIQKFLKKNGFYNGAYTKKLDKATVIAWQKYINSKL